MADADDSVSPTDKYDRIAAGDVAAFNCALTAAYRVYLMRSSEPREAVHPGVNQRASIASALAAIHAHLAAIGVPPGPRIMIQHLIQAIVDLDAGVTDDLLKPAGVGSGRKQDPAAVRDLRAGLAVALHIRHVGLCEPLQPAARHIAQLFKSRVDHKHQVPKASDIIA